MAGHIYHGAWINWSRGGITLGATLTTSNRSGGLLTSFIATFVTLVGVQLWKILAFALHQIRSTPEPRDGLYHQQQAIWRNSAGPGGAAWSFLQQAWCWRTRAKYSLWRTFTWAVFAATYLVVFAVLAVFSSQISKSPGPQRLLVTNTDSCGYWALDTNSTDAGRALSSRQSNVSQSALTYARACYGNANSSLTCSRFAKPIIEWTPKLNMTCPFQSGICGYGDHAAFEMTSQVINSQSDMGINTKPDERIEIQKRTTCAPIRDYKYLREENITFNNDNGVAYNDTWYRLYLGPFIDGRDNSTIVNYTAQAPQHGFRCSAGYEVSSVFAQADRSKRSDYDGWVPIPELRRNDSDTVLIFLKQNAMRYWDRTFDPWFWANWTMPTQTESLGAFGASDWITTLGCAEQYRFCNPNNGLCTAYAGALQTGNSALNSTASPSPLGLNTMQQYLAGRYALALQMASMNSLTTALGAYGLRAQQTVSDTFQTANLPNDQWQKEVSGWFDAGLAAIQALIVEYATGPPYIVSGSMLLQHGMPGKMNYYDTYMCNNQLVNDTADTMSFSILGMGVLFIVGGIIILSSFFIDRLVGSIQTFFRLNFHGQRAWILDDKLQMQKSIFESTGMGRWKDGDLDSIPVTVMKGEFSRFPTDQLLGRDQTESPHIQTHYQPHYQPQYHETMSPNQNDGPFNAPHYTEMEYMGPYHDDKKGPSTYSRSRQSSSSYLRSVT